MAIEPQFLPSPKRYWLDAPKEEPHTCFVKDSDYTELRAVTTRLQLERDLHRNEASRLRKALEKIAHPEHGLRPQDKEPFLKGFVPLDRRIAIEALQPASALETALAQEKCPKCLNTGWIPACDAPYGCEEPCECTAVNRGV